MNQEAKRRSVGVIGAGVTGLSAAYVLHKRGHTVHLIERSRHAGGVIQSTAEEGYLVEAGPNTMLVNEQSLLDFFNEIGLRDSLVEASPHASNRYIVRDGRPVAVPTSPLQLLRTPLFSAGAKLRLLTEPFRGRGDPPYEESVASFATRRLGTEILDYAVNPFVGGIFAGDPARLAMRFAFPKLHQIEEEGSSLLRGALAAAKAGRRSGVPRFKPRSISFRSGLHELIDALVREVGDSLHLGVTATAIRPGSPWHIELARTGEASRQIRVDSVVIATPAHATAGLPLQLEGDVPLAALSAIEHPPVASIALGFLRSQVRHPLDGYGVLVPERENSLHILGTLFNSSLFPNRAPDGHVLLTTFAGGMRRPEIARLESSRLQQLVLEDLDRILGISGPPVFSRVTVWPHAIPQYNIGFESIRRAMEEVESALPGLFIGGQCRDGVSIGDCIRAGWRLAERAGG